MAQLFQFPKGVPLSSGVVVPGAKAYFYEPGTTTPRNVYTNEALTVAHSNPVVADASGVFAPIWIDPVLQYKLTLNTSADVLIYTVDPATGSFLDSLERTAAEIAAGVTPTNYAYAPGDVRRYGAVGDDSTNDTTAIQNAINVTDTVHFYDGVYRCVGLTGSTNLQRFIAHGDVSLRKNGNGVILAHSGADVVLEGIQFRGESASYTGNNVNLTGERPTLINCSSRDAAALALLATKNRVRILGSCDIYQTAATGASDYDIEIGTSGTATLYHVLQAFNSSQSTGGVRFIDCGGQAVIGCQIGKLFVDAGTSPAGVNGGMYVGNRILGNTTVEISNAIFAANQFGAITLTLAAGTSGITIDASNTFQSGATVTNSGNANNLIVRQVSSGSTINLQFGDDSSAAIVEITPTSDGTFEFNRGVTLKNTRSLTLEGTTPGTDGVIQMTSGDNLQITNEANAGDSIIITQAGAGTVSVDINGARSAQFDATTTAGRVRFLVYDVDNGQLEPVSVGAADSGGAGFKILRIPN